MGGAGAHRNGEDVVAAVVYATIAIVGLVSGELFGQLSAAAQALAASGPRNIQAMAVVLLVSWLGTAGAAWLLANGRLRVPSLLVASAALPAPVAATLASLSIAPAAYETAAAAAGFEEATFARAAAIQGTAGVLSIGLWGAAIALVIAAAGLSFAGRRKRRVPAPSATARLVVGAGGLAALTLATLPMLTTDLGAQLRSILVPAALALLAAHLTRDARRTADIATAGCAAASILTATFAVSAGAAGGVGVSTEGAAAFIAATGGFHDAQRRLAIAGALYVLPAVGVVVLAARGKPFAARHQAKRILGYGLLLVATSAAAAALLLPDLRASLARSWARHVPPGFDAIRLDLALDSCHDPRPATILFLGRDGLWIGDTMVGAATRLDTAEGCAGVTAELPTAPTIAVAASLPAARVNCLLQAVAARTCTVRWLLHHESSEAEAPVCLPTILTGGRCPTPPGGPLALVDGDRRYLLDHDLRRTASLDEVAGALAASTGGVLAATGRTAWADLLATGARVREQRPTARHERRIHPVRLAIAERPTATSPALELALPFRSEVEVRLDPPVPALASALDQLSDRLRRCYQPDGDWPPATSTAAHWLLLGSPSPSVWRTDLEPLAGASACAARALDGLPPQNELPVRLEVTIRTSLPRVDLTPRADAEAPDQAAIDTLRARVYHNRGELDRCYQTGLERNPTLTGAVALSLTRGERGYVDVFVPGLAAPDQGLSEVAECLANVLRQHLFPAPPAPASLELIADLVLPQ